MCDGNLSQLLKNMNKDFIILALNVLYRYYSCGEFTVSTFRESLKKMPLLQFSGENCLSVSVCGGKTQER
jgi:hypothetical protein